MVSPYYFQLHNSFCKAPASECSFDQVRASVWSGDFTHPHFEARATNLRLGPQRQLRGSRHNLILSGFPVPKYFSMFSGVWPLLMLEQEQPLELVCVDVG